MSVYEAQQRISSREFAEWMAYDRLDPIGEWRHDGRAAMMCSVVANCHRGKNQRPYRSSDFMPKYDGNCSRKQSVEEMHARFKLYAEAHNARLNRGGG